jgi:arylsulfatase A-like enzyme
MNVMARSLLGAAMAAFILAGAEAVVSYPGPSGAASMFFTSAFVAYLPVAAALALVCAMMSPDRGLDFWFPVLVGASRMTAAVTGGLAAGRFKMLVAMAIGLALLPVARRMTDAAGKRPPFLFGLTVGIALPILAARFARGLFDSGSGGAFKDLAAGSLLGLFTFVLLRATVMRWPRLAPVFVLGPVVSVAVWSRPAHRSPSVNVSVVAAETRGRPDIALIVLDTLRARALASYGYPVVTMPGLEAFARRATRFDRAWSNGSWTLPAHASLFSGLRLTRHRYDLGFSASERSSPDGFLAERLRRAGYATGAVVANHAIFGRDAALFEGFESIDSEPLRPIGFRPWLFDWISAFPRSAWLKETALRFPGPSRRSPWIVEKAISFWSRADERPRFLFANLMEAHLPWVPDEPDLGRLGPRGLETEAEQVQVVGRSMRVGGLDAANVALLAARYHEALYSLDRSLTRLLDVVAKGRAGRDVIVVVTADHGESLGEHGRLGHLSSLDEEVTRIPLFLSGPGLAAGSVDAPVQLVDIFGYLIRSAGVELDEGLDARPFGARQHVVIEHRPGWQGALPASYPRGDLSALIDWPYKYVGGPFTPGALFDLSADPREASNLVLGQAERAATMRKVLLGFSALGSTGSRRLDPTTDERLRALGYVR